MGIAALAVSSPGLVGADSSSLTPHGPIFINGDADFTSANGVTGGTGTASDPYIIQGWSITSCCNSPGILIEDTSAYFVIRNLYVNPTGWQVYGVNITNVANGALENSHFNGKWPLSGWPWSLAVDSSRNILVSGDVINFATIDSSQNITVSGSGSNYGLLTVTSSDNITLTNDTFPEWTFGLSIVDSTRVTVENNTLSQIWLGETSSEQLDSVTITPDNTANGRPLLFYKDCSNLNLDSTPSGELIFANCSNVALTNLTVGSYPPGAVEMTFDTNVFLENVTAGDDIRVINSIGVEISNIHGTGIRVDSSDRVQIFDNTARVTGYVGVSSSTNVSITDNLHYPIALENSSNVTVSGNNLGAGCCTTDFTGLRIENSDHITVSGNSFYSDYAIVGENSGFLQISDNQISDAGYGAILLNSCSDVSIQRNVIGTSGGAYRPRNPAVGVTKAARINISENNITQSFDPIQASFSQNVSIVGNNISNSTTAIVISDASHITINGNNIQSNMQGVVLNDTMNVQVFHNNFLNNTVQAIDTFSTQSVWDNGYPSGGNYWSDYTGTDPDTDGIGDTPYAFNYNQDNYPLMAPYNSASQSTPPSPTTYAISWQGYDWDGSGEETIALNGQFLGSLPTRYSPQNGGSWVVFSLNTTLLVQGTNTLTFTHANSDCPYVDQVSNLVVSNQTSTVYSNATVENINTAASCTNTLTYTFTV